MFPSMVMFLLLLFQFITTHSGNCQKHSAKEISFGLYKSPPTMMLGFLHRQPEYCSFSYLPMLCLDLLGAGQGEDLDPSNPEAANLGLCLQTLMTKNSY